ncbi:hypothetical protein AB0L41_42065 [Amycolatopsis mediterranei]|uniref:hypothetical protein n=1 Tax=Amycolatopsis mediterranei TaxID=33910 RepID=UPI003448E7B9
MVTELESRITDPSFGMALPYMPPHLLAIRAEIARHRQDADAAGLLLRARDQFRAGGWRHRPTPLIRSSTPWPPTADESTTQDTS